MEAANGWFAAGPSGTEAVTKSTRKLPGRGSSPLYFRRRSGDREQRVGVRTFHPVGLHEKPARIAAGYRRLLHEVLADFSKGLDHWRAADVIDRLAAKTHDYETIHRNHRRRNHLYKAKNDISPDRWVELSALLNQRLASAIDLQMQMKQANWNVKGPNFISLHGLFDKVNEAVAGYVDQIAERIVQLGGIAEGTARVSAARSQLGEYPLTIADGRDHVDALSTSLSTFGQESRMTIDEADALDERTRRISSPRYRME